MKIEQIDTACYCSEALEILKLDLTGVREVYFLAVYRPPDGAVKEFVEEIDKIINGLSRKTNIEVKIVGDINIDLRKRNLQVKLYQQAGVCPTDESDHYVIYASRKKF